MRFFATTFAICVALIIGRPAYGAISCTGGGIYFSETGSTSGTPQDAEACITIGVGTITVVLQNDVPVITNNPSEFDGFQFDLIGSGFTVSSTISSVVATNPIFCSSTAGEACIVDPAGYVDQSSSTPQTSPYEWTIGGTGVITASPTGTLLAAGGDSLHPFAIVNDSVLTNTSQQLSATGHNDFLEGPVTFTLDYTGTAPTGVSAATFYFGTNGDAQTGILTKQLPTVPEPSSVLLLLTVLVFAGKILKGRLTP